MMKLFNFLFNLKKKEIEPKLFVFVLSAQGMSQLALNTNYEFEVALNEARQTFINFLKGKGHAEPLEVKVEMWVSTTLFDIFGNYIDSDIQETITKEDEDKNKLMAEIITKKDETLIEKHADKLSEYDKKYLREQIKHETSKQSKK